MLVDPDILRACSVFEMCGATDLVIVNHFAAVLIPQQHYHLEPGGHSR